MSFAVDKKMLTLDPTGSRGVILEKERFEHLRDFIVSCFSKEAEISFNELMQKATTKGVISERDNSIWYFLKVKQHLQAKGVLRVKFLGRASRAQVLKLNRKALKSS